MQIHFVFFLFFTFYLGRGEAQGFRASPLSGHGIHKGQGSSENWLVAVFSRSARAGIVSRLAHSKEEAARFSK